MNQLQRMMGLARGLTAPVLASLIVVAAASLCSPVSASDESKPASKSVAPTNAAPDRVVLRSGKVVDGLILEETETQITMTVVVAGISAKTTYPKSDILEIKRGNNVKPADDAAVKAAETTTPAALEKPADTKPATDTLAKDDDPDLTRLYLVKLEGRFGSDIAKTTLANLFSEADKELGDAVPGAGTMQGKTVVDPSKRDRNIIVLKLDTGSEGRSDLFKAEDIVPVVKEQIVDRGRRVVFWIQRATGWAAVFPFVSPDIYFTPDGRLGGVSDLDEFDIGDHLVNEKQISLRIGHAEGFLIKGGYGEHIPALHAMLRKQEWLYVKFEGGKPIYLERELEESDGDGWTLLSDDGAGDNKDESALSGNDLFLLEPDWAEKLGISDGTAATIDDLAFRLGVHRHYKTIEKNKAQKAVDAWKSGIADAIKDINPQQTEQRRLGRLWREINELPAGSDFDERKKSRGKKITLLRQIRSIISKYAEVFDADGTWRSRIDVDLAKLQQEAEEDARQNRSQNSGGGGRR
ncbi:MAG: hypothetical protein JNK58_06715 [Phycisphaerae bacterium]|nr:hypothetical protein [Phycisphaerae bacterium]